MVDLKEYFDVNLVWKNDRPIITLKIKPEYYNNSDSILKWKIYKKIPNSISNIEYYLHHFGDNDLAREIANCRKSLCSSHARIKWYIDNYNVDIETKNKLNEYLNTIGLNISKNLKEFYDSIDGEKTRVKLKARSEKWAPIIGQKNKEKWQDADWANLQKKTRHDTGQYDKIRESNAIWHSNPINKEKFIESCNKKDRVDKISIAAKNMWQDAKSNNLELYYKMLKTGSSKNYELNGVKMNSIEYLVGAILNELKIEWKYEYKFEFDKNTYFPDFYLPQYNTIIECYGDFWHACPLKFKEGQNLFKTLKVEDKWKQDLNRMHTFQSNGFKYLVYWEHEINDELKIIKERINNEIH